MLKALVAEAGPKANNIMTGVPSVLLLVARHVQPVGSGCRAVPKHRMALGKRLQAQERSAILTSLVA